ncbi:MAG: cold shock domain-containing protein [Pseudomonadales bacterium]|nr:cold shock domain-containing protein [Pseudomonadales bacterium]
MNQRIILPAIVIGGLFAAALTFLRGQLPAAGTAELFAVDLIVIIVALIAYGSLMRAALSTATATSTAKPNAAGKHSETPSPSGRRNERKGRERGGAERGNAERGSKRGSRNRRDDTRAGSGRREREEQAPAVPAGPREEGTVKWFSGAKGYGFIIRPDGEEIFLHHRALRDKSRREIPDGHPVSYVVVERDKGPQADDVDLTGARENAA